MVQRRVVLGVLLTVAARSAAAVAAPALPALPAQSEPFKPGTWVQYLFTPVKTGAAFMVRLSALEHEAGGQWFEMAFKDTRRQTLLVKVLVEGSLLSPRRVLRAIVQPQGQQALLLPERLARQQLPRFRPDPAKQAKRVGRASVTVPAGSFSAERYRMVESGRATELWTSTQVAGWPMVKMQSPELLVELAAHGKGARSELRGKPAKLDERWVAPPPKP